MPRRKDRFGYGVTIPATTARVVDTAVEILGNTDPFLSMNRLALFWRLGIRQFPHRIQYPPPRPLPIHVAGL